MAFRIEVGERLNSALPRCIGEQLDAARVHLQRSGADLHDGVHDARRSIRRARAALALLRPQLDDDACEALAATIAEAGRVLSPLRDAQSVIEAVEQQLQQPGMLLPAPVVQRLLGGLRRRRGQASRRSATVIAASDAALAAFGSGLRDAFSEFDEAALAAGLRLGRRRLRKAMRAARAAVPASDALHCFRQRARVHWLQLELVIEAWPAVVSAQAAEAKKLSQLLGSERDLHLLSTFIAGLHKNTGNGLELAPIENYIARRRLQLQAQAFALGGVAVCRIQCSNGAADQGVAQRAQRLASLATL